MFLNDADVRAIKDATSLNSLLQLTYRNYATFIGSSSSVLFSDAVYLCISFTDMCIPPPYIKDLVQNGHCKNRKDFKPLSESAFLENASHDQIMLSKTFRMKVLTTATAKPTLRKTVILHLKSRMVLAPEGIY